MNRRTPLLALACVLTLGLSACGAFDRPASNNCSADSDCDDAHCDVDLGFCVAPPPRASLSIGLEVVPASDPFGGTVVPVSFGPTDVFRMERDLALPFGVRVTGGVRSLLEHVDAEVSFSLVSAIPGGPVSRTTTQTFLEPMRAGAGMLFNYATQLLPGRIYEVVVQPNGEWRSVLPPLYYRFETPTGGDRHQNLDYPDELAEVEGVIVDAEREPQAGMTVHAFELVSGRVVSSTYLTGQDENKPPGYFKIRITPGAESWFFVLSSSADRIDAMGPSPTFTVDPSSLLPDSDGQVTILMPSAPTVVTYAGLVEANSVPVSGATLILESDDVADDSTGVVGSFRSMVVTDDVGQFEAALLPGTYDVLITPQGSALSVARERVRLDPEGHDVVVGQLFELSPRHRVSGSVVSPEGEPMVDTRVQGRSRGSDAMGELDQIALYARSDDTLTDRRGEFDLNLDLGFYDLIVQPVAGSNYPWSFERGVMVGDSVAAPEQMFTAVYPVPLTGRVSFADGSPAAMAEIRAYALISDGDNTETLQVARATTDEDGHYLLLLPPNL